MQQQQIEEDATTTGISIQQKKLNWNATPTNGIGMQQQQIE
jgi:hypothetical protein